MLKTRVIPCLLLKGRGLVKTIQFDKPTYIGDPINAVKIFNEKEVDELVFLDIDASKEHRGPNFSLLKDITDECFMPLAYGGGVTTVEQVKELLKVGVEKIVVNTSVFENPKFVEEAVKIFGSSTIVGSMDVKRNLFGKSQVYIRGGSKSTKISPLDYVKRLESLGVGEVFLNSIDQDGKMNGYDIPLISSLASVVSVPLVASGGAGSVSDFKKAKDAGASAVAAGSMFVFKGQNRAVLISYPSIGDLEKVLK